ncbi:SURF1 family cytochrome oxidase biogenesis protein [Nigerium massiliense]|uniref:SURF1 family cytochrome oxidase biogenesis protein n=1 Tax=Nigerium massiliense TaxID=1522317 RepID=UPI0006933193|nr:SURF1 family protein [Nigerium massiliense]
MGASRDPDSKPWARWIMMGVFVVALALLFVRLGEWQLDRLDQRRARNAVVVEHENKPVADFASVMNRPITEADQWQRVRVTGTFDASHQLLVRYRSNGDQTGWEVVTPLRATDGRTVLVDRGFAPRPPGQDFPPPAALPAPPSGQVSVVGHVRRNEQGADNATVPLEGSVRLINSVKIGESMGVPLVDGYIGLLEVQPAQSGGLSQVEPPPLDEGPHLSYALQWFSFTAIAAIGLVILIRNDVRDRRKARARREDARAAAASGGESHDAPLAAVPDHPTDSSTAPKE